VASDCEDSVDSSDGTSDVECEDGEVDVYDDNVADIKIDESDGKEDKKASLRRLPIF